MLNLYQDRDLDGAVSNFGIALDALRGARILLTGGTGFFGRWLIATLIHAEHLHGLNIRISVVTRSARTFAINYPDLVAAPIVETVEGDVATFRTARSHFSHVIHAATETSQDAEREPMLLARSIVDGTRTMLAVAQECGCQDMLFLSSGAVYGEQGDLDAIPETFSGGPDPLDRRSVYGNAKRMAEQFCAVAASESNLRIKVARCFSFVGPGLPLNGHFAIGNFIADALRGRPIIIKGDGKPMRSYLYTGDLAAWLMRILVNGQSGRAYNVGADEALSIAELAKRVVRVLDARVPVEIANVAPNTHYRSRYIPSIARARTELGLDVWTSLDEAILRTAEWARAAGRVGA